MTEPAPDNAAPASTRPVSPFKSISSSVLIPILFAALIFAAGAYARFTELEWHFTTVDDTGVAEIILENRETGQWGPLPIPVYYTYAPFQYFFTDLLIAKDQPYRELLFRGRLPSVLFGLMGVLAMMLFFRRLYGRGQPHFIPAMLLLAFSWENIAHSKQMHPYAVGVFGAVCVFLLLADSLKQNTFKWTRALVTAFLLAVIANMQYQLIPFVAAFYMCLGLFVLAAQTEKLKTLLKLFVSGSLFGTLYFPTWFFFLRHHLAENAGAPKPGWGENGEFLFTTPASESLAAKASYVLHFFVGNLYTVFESKTAFLPVDHVLMPWFGLFFFTLFLLGAVSYFFTQNEAKRWTGVYFSIVVGFWILLVITGKLTFGPSRHTLILLPVFCVVTAEGFKVLTRKLASPLPVYGFAIVSLALFLFYYPVFLKEHRDPFREQEILKILKRYDVNALLVNKRTDQVLMMKSIKEYQENVNPGKEPYASVAWISRRDVDFSYDNCEFFRNAINQRKMTEARAKGLDARLAIHPCTDYELVYADRRPSDVQVDYSRVIQSEIYTNSYFLYVARLKNFKRNLSDTEQI